MAHCPEMIKTGNFDLLLQWVSVVELGQATVELAGVLEAVVVGVTACQNNPCPFLAGLSIGGGVYGGGGEEVHSREERKRDWNIG